MNEYLKKVVTQIIEFVKGLPPGKKLAMFGTGSLIAVVIGGLFIMAGRTTYQPLMNNLSAEDSAAVIRILREKRIPFKVDETGKNISIPPESVYDLRLELAMGGFPQSSTAGYETIDKQGLGTSSMVQKLNQKRALEGELMRTIQGIKGVRRSRIHLATPQKTAFAEDQRRPSASVVLDLEPGVTLNDKQVYGIGNLVARAVEGLDVGDVVIVDNQGKQLSKNTGDSAAQVSSSQLDHRQKVEKDLEKRIEEMLGRVVGEGRVVARVTADLDFSQVSETSTTYDADGTATRNIARDTKSMEGSRPGGGLAGAQSNSPGLAPAPNQVRSDTKTNSESITYDVPQTVRRTQKAMGTPKRLSVAVVVDGKTVKSTDKDGAVLSKVEAWSPEKLKEFESVVANAVGLDRKRGDTLEIKNMEFTHEDFDEATKLLAENERRAYMRSMVLYGLVGITIVLFFLLVVRPFIKWITENTIDSVDSFLPQTIEELEKMQKNAQLPGLEDAMPVLPDRVDPEKVEGEMIKEKIITLVDTNPHKAALILRDWLHVPKKLDGIVPEPGKAPAGPGKGKTA